MAKTSFDAATPVLSISECADLIAAIGDKVAVLVQGDMGSGKSSLLKTLAKRFPNHYPAYVDMATKDIGDIQIPHILSTEHTSYVRFAPNEEFGLQHGKPVLMMLDEIGKNRGIMNAVTRILQEFSVGNMALPPGSIVFATTNLGAENVGDSLPPHVRNRINIVRMKKPNAEQWLAWGMENDMEPALMAAVHEFPQMLESFTDVDDFKNNPYIYDPRDPSRTSFVTPRSLEKLSHLLKKRSVLNDHIVLQGAMGLVGAKAANDIMTLVTLGDTLPRFEEYATDPKKTKVPESAAACIMVALTAIQRTTQADFNNVATYLERFQMEVQALFYTTIVKSSKGPWVCSMSKCTEFIHKNNALFRA